MGSTNNYSFVKHSSDHFILKPSNWEQSILLAIQDNYSNVLMGICINMALTAIFPEHYCHLYFIHLLCKINNTALAFFIVIIQKYHNSKCFEIKTNSILTTQLDLMWIHHKTVSLYECDMCVRRLMCYILDRHPHTYWGLCSADQFKGHWPCTTSGFSWCEMWHSP